MERADGTTSYRFEASRWTLTDKIAGGATLLVLIALFLPWFDVYVPSGAFGVSFPGVNGVSASASGTTAHGWLWFVFAIGLIMLLYLLLDVAGFQRLPVALSLKRGELLLAATGINLLLVVIAFVLKPGNEGFTQVKISWGFGAFITVIAAIAAVVPSALAAVAKR
jgi:hypothetical protein